MVVSTRSLLSCPGPSFVSLSAPLSFPAHPPQKTARHRTDRTDSTTAARFRTECLFFSFIFRKTEFQVKTGLLLTFFCHLPVVHSVQIRNICVCLKGVCDFC